jgi:hypothetical protein
MAGRSGLPHKKWRISAVSTRLARLSRSIWHPGPSGRTEFAKESVMLKIRIPFAVAATVAAALMTFVTVVPPPASANTGDCVARSGTSRDLPVLA